MRACFKYSTYSFFLRILKKYKIYLRNYIHMYSFDSIVFLLHKNEEYLKINKILKAGDVIKRYVIKEKVRRKREERERFIYYISVCYNSIKCYILRICAMSFYYAFKIIPFFILLRNILILSKES